HGRGEIERATGSGGRFQHDGAAGSDHLESQLDTRGAAGAIDDHVLIMARIDVGQRTRTDRPLFAERELLRVLSDDANGTAGITKHLRDEQTEATVSQNGDPLARVKLDLLEDLEGGRER